MRAVADKMRGVFVVYAGALHSGIGTYVNTELWPLVIPEIRECALALALELSDLSHSVSLWGAW